MKHLIYILTMAAVLAVCACSSRADKSSDGKKAASAERPVLKVYNMGGVPADSVSMLARRLKAIYPNTVAAGSMQMVDSALIRGDRKGKDRYWARVMMNNLKKNDGYGKDIILVVVNGEICSWLNNGSHANLGISLPGRSISLVSYRRLEMNGLNTVDNMLKVAVHELGHSVCSLVKERKDLRQHCPDKNCLMRDAKKKFPYRNVSGFCASCDSVMNAHGFITKNLGL